MIYITGDTHNDFTRFTTDAFPEQMDMSKSDTVIICGDFGGVWNYDGESKTEKWWLKWLNQKPFTTVFVDGNHENHLRLAKYPVKKWNGGNVHKIRPSVFHLMRGEVYTIEDKKFFAFGGAASHDIRDGILDPIKDADVIKRWKYDWAKEFRVLNRTWWKEELPSQKEMDNGFANLEKNDYKVDFIITHCTSSSTAALLSQGAYKPDMLTSYLEEVRAKTNYKRWFFGHYHTNERINDKDICLYEQILRIN
jgi:hypothetical protein